MYKLVLVQKGRIQDNIILRHETTIIGRRADADICLNDPSVSGHHARITRKGQNVTIEDLDSTNGTTLNGKPVTQIPLQTGDQISIGNYKLIFVTEKDNDADPDATMIMPSRQPAIVQEDSSSTDASSRQGKSWLFWLVSTLLICGIVAAWFLLQ